MAKTIKELFDLTGKTAVVTGGSRGIGKEMAEGLAEAGANLMLCARRIEWLDEAVEEFRGKNFHVHGKICDVTKAQDVQAVVDETIEKFGKIDILINNAGISWGAMPEEMPLEKWQKVIDVNLTGCFIFAQAVGREMLKVNSGSIINIASISGLTSSANGPFYAGYVASKAGLIGLTRELAASWGRRGIRVNAIAPGFFHSRLTDAVIDIYERSIQENNAIPRIGAKGELKGAAVFLASDASSYITGQTIAVDGGMTI
ncbi:MAG: glucose 1-dehydrogenase [Acidobacteria bacterium]|nr:glucose 1-dehydrogenase [Acidobacteriota bacterium]